MTDKKTREKFDDRMRQCANELRRAAISLRNAANFLEATSPDVARRLCANADSYEQLQHGLMTIINENSKLLTRYDPHNDYQK